MSEDRAALAAEYEEVTGKQIFKGWKDEEIRERLDKAKKAAADLDEEPAYQPRKVKVRILPMGDGKVHTGRRAFEKAGRGDILTVDVPVGETLQARGFAEIINA
ncbi:MAG: hypothetical protein VX529_10980 [Pseudomonadota bacterium]|nr:hypothetical protein [Pseudomonadota bacterium]